MGIIGARDAPDRPGRGAADRYWLMYQPPFGERT
jgi:hypothetical protein